MPFDRALFDALEPGQRSEISRLPLPRKQLGWSAKTLLVILRIYVVVAIPVVIYAFNKALDH